MAPDWNACLEYEFQLRKQACKLTREDPQHRMTHWISLSSITNNKDDSGATEVAALRKRLASVERARSRPAKAQKGSSTYGSGAASRDDYGRPKGKDKQNNKAMGNGKGKKIGKKEKRLNRKAVGPSVNSMRSP